MAVDLSRKHELVSDMFSKAVADSDWSKYRLTDDQVTFFNENGYLFGVKILEPPQVDRLCDELAKLVDPNHDGREFFYEYNSNESVDPSRVLFHALGAWRVTPGFHD